MRFAAISAVLVFAAVFTAASPVERRWGDPSGPDWKRWGEGDPSGPDWKRWGEGDPSGPDWKRVDRE
ncbi:hypothetical protein BC835DRAFT_1412123 [Cytidiella melzeri]|nr:hypothetical protein BC835DRAFT_1412123 [Cytidiella melzeri]